jgi:hypothetical protein
LSLKQDQAWSGLYFRPGPADDLPLDVTNPEVITRVMSQTIINPSIASQNGRRLGCSSVSQLCSWLAMILVGWARIVGAEELQTPVADAEAQEHVIQFLQTIIQDYWNGGFTNKTGSTNTLGNYTNVESAFREASRLMPGRLDLRFGLASALVAQAVQTNGVKLELKMKEALEIYKEIHALAPKGVTAPIWYAAYTRALGDTNASEAAISGLMTAYSERTREYVEELNLADRILEITPDKAPCRTMPKDKRHAIVILGAGLETNGNMKVKLTGRLEQGLKLARMYRKAPIIVTGGNQKGGVTEAYVMAQWFIHKGIFKKRLFLEDQAKDTMENALFSAPILKKLGITHVTLVTSPSHIHRGLVDLEQACRQLGLKLEYTVLAASAKGDTELDKEQERVGIYRDVLRTGGLWAFPGMRR